MKNKHIVNIKENLLFLSICRHTLYEMFDDKELRNFIKNEATDYQILNIIVDNEIPLEKNNITVEEQHLDTCRQIISEVDGDQGAYVQGLYNNMKSSMKTMKSMTDKTKSVDPKTPLDKIAVGVNAGTAASIIKFSAAKLYKDYLIKASKLCVGRPDKVDCIAKAKDTALNMRIEKLRSGMSLCNKAKNSDACKKSLQRQITRLQTKADQ